MEMVSPHRPMDVQPLSAGGLHLRQGRREPQTIDGQPSEDIRPDHLQRHQPTEVPGWQAL